MPSLPTPPIQVPTAGAIDTRHHLDLMMAAVDAEIDRDAADLISLGEMAAALRPLEQCRRVMFDSGAYPGSIGSYRGYYRFPALGRDGDESESTVGELLEEVEGAIGRTYTGYKGGDYEMTRQSPLWASEYGHASGVGIVGVNTKGNAVVLVTKEIDP